MVLFAEEIMATKKVNTFPRVPEQSLTWLKDEGKEKKTGKLSRF